MLSNKPFVQHDAEIDLEVENFDGENVQLHILIKFTKDICSRTGKYFYFGEPVQIRSSHGFSGAERKSWNPSIKESIDNEVAKYFKEIA